MNENNQIPVLYQTRMRPCWREPDTGWSEWTTCSKEAYEDTAKLDIYSDWQYQARKLYTEPVSENS